MLRKLLYGMIISTVVINAGSVEAKAEWWKVAPQTNESSFFQNVYNVLNLGNLEAYYQIFDKQSINWKNFDSLKKEKDLDKYIDLYSKYSSEFSTFAAEFYRILKTAGNVNNIPLYDETSRQYKNATRKSVYAALKSLSAAIKSQHDTIKNMIQKAEKKLASGRYTKGNQQLIDSHIQSVAQDIKRDKTVVRQYNEIVKRLAAVCKLLHVNKAFFDNINSQAMDGASPYGYSSQPAPYPGQFTNTDQQITPPYNHAL